MLHARHTLTHAHVLATLLLLTACGASHGATDAGVDSSSGDAALDSGASDTGTTDTGPVDSGSDAGTRDVCAPEDAAAELCAPVLCDGPSTWHWDGDHCVEIDCGACRGADCDSAPTTRDACEAAHAGCDVSLCRGTGGTWAWWLPVCGHYVCGEPPPEDCEVAGPGCDCGAGASFVDGIGCRPDPSCPDRPAMTDAELCASTGGTFDASCCPTTCGVPCAAECLAPACTCGPTEVWDPARGCVTGRECLERALGESCTPDARCEDGTICCDACGGAGCAGNPTCKLPVCSDDPAIDTCGNNSLAP